MVFRYLKVRAEKNNLLHLHAKFHYQDLKLKGLLPVPRYAVFNHIHVQVCTLYSIYQHLQKVLIQHLNSLKCLAKTLF
jgi:hypothetical protein